MKKYTVLRPKVNSVSLAPNPVSVGGSVTVSAAVSEAEKDFYEQSFYSGQFHTGGFFIGQSDPDLGRTWEELDALGLTWNDWDGAAWFSLMYGSFE